ncbi:hypothetical protein H0H81_000812 [Sphagnurus paluster]|uniref:Uncharacterized protein n=1 Tax=Sphagnurus paluster TaxID=117069 RepID=A0A9P7G028_9AGAR|nr:hypothetical protein H0H81_000812 [Sphagnurus paluster]
MTFIAVRITISVLLGLGVLCFALILNTFRHYGSAMSRRFAETIKQRTGQQLNSKPKNRLERSRHTFPGYSSGLGLTPNPLYPANMPSWGPIPVGGSSPSMYWNPHTLAGTRRQNVAHHVASERPPIIPRRGETPYTYGESLPDVDSDRSPPSASRNPGNNERLQSWQGQHSTSDLPPNPAQARNVAPPPILAVSYLVPTAVTNTESLNGPPLSSPSNLALIQHGTHISPTQANYNPGTGHPTEHRSQADAPLNTLERPTGVYVWVPPDNYPQFYDDPSQPPPTRPQRETPYGESLPDVEDEFERSAPSPSRSPSDNEQRQLWGEQYPTSYLPPNRTEPRNVTPPPTPAALHFAPVVAANTGGFPSSEGPSFEPIPQIPQMPERHGSSHPLSPPSTLASIESGSTASPSRLIESNLGRHRMYPYAMSTDYSERPPGLYDSVGRQGSYPGFGDIPSETPPARSRREAPYVQPRSRWSTGPSFSHSPGDGERPHLWGEEYSPLDPPQEVRNITPPPTPAALNLVPAVAANSENPPSPEEMFIGPIPQLDLGIERYGSSDPVSPLSTLASIESGTGNPSRLAQSNLNRLSIQLYQSDTMPTSSPERPIGEYDLEFIPQSPPTEIEATIRGAVSFQMTHSTLTTVNPPAAYQAHGEGAVYVPPRASTPWPTRGSDRPSTENPQHVNRGASTSSGTRHVQSEGSRPSSGSSTNSSRSTRRRRKRLRFLPFDELDSISGIWQKQRYGDSQADGGDEYITAEAGMNHPRRQQIQYIRTIFWRVSPTSSPRPWSTPHILERELETEGDEQEYVNTESYQNMTVHDTDGTPAGAHALQEQNANEAPSQTVSAGPTATSAPGLQYTDEREGHRFFGRSDRRELQFREPSEDSLSFSMQPLRVEENQISGVLESDELYVSGEWLAI